MKKLLLPLLLACALVSPARAADRLRIITTTTDLADIAHRLAGDRADVEALAKGFQNPHFVDAKPSLIVKLMKANVFIQSGLELEIGWAPPLLQGARNKAIAPGGAGFIDASTAITPIEVTANPTRAEGDVHPQGNPHYMTDPQNAAPVARLIATRLKTLDPAGATTYDANLKAFTDELTRRMAAWTVAMAPYKGARYVSYHRDWSYFAARFGLESVGEIEPKPGIPPTASHTAALIDTMKKRGATFILTDPWFESRTGEFMAAQTGARLLPLSLYPGGVPETDGYFETIDHNVQAFSSKSGGK